LLEHIGQTVDDALICFEESRLAGELFAGGFVRVKASVLEAAREKRACGVVSMGTLVVIDREKKEVPERVSCSPEKTSAARVGCCHGGSFGQEGLENETGVAGVVGALQNHL
jgi:hypothetical protein